MASMTAAAGNKGAVNAFKFNHNNNQPITTKKEGQKIGVKRTHHQIKNDQNDRNSSQAANAINQFLAGPSKNKAAKKTDEDDNQIEQDFYGAGKDDAKEQSFDYFNKEQNGKSSTPPNKSNE